MGKKVWLKRIAVAAALGFVLFAFGWVPYFLAGIATTRRFQFPDRENVGLTPATFQLASEDVAFRSADGVELEAWWVPGARGEGHRGHGPRVQPLADRDGAARAVRPRRGVERSPPRPAPPRRERGQDHDLRGEGEEGRGGRRPPRAGAFPGPVVLWGVSLGGASVVFAAAEDPQVAGVICDSSYRSLEDTVRHHLQLFRGWRWWLRIVPRWPVADLTVFWMGRRGGFDPATVDVRVAAARLAGRPALFVANSDDQRMPKEIAFDLQAAVGPGAEVLIVPGKSHGGAWRDGTAAYEAAAAALLEAAQHGPASRMAAR